MGVGATLVARATAGADVVVVGRRITAAIGGVGALFGTKSLPHTESPPACAANTTGKYAADDTHNSQANRVTAMRHHARFILQSSE
jgi:hypothetical protein